MVQRDIGKTQDDVMLHQSTVGYLIVTLNQIGAILGNLKTNSSYKPLA